MNNMTNTIDPDPHSEAESFPHTIPASNFRMTHKPRLIVLIRHGESESNKDKLVNEHTPNHLIPLTKNGWAEANHAGLQLLKILNVDSESIVEKLSEKYTIENDTRDMLPLKNYEPLNKRKDMDVVFYASPYRRTRETLKGILDVIDEYNQMNTGLVMPVDNCYQPCNKKKSATWKQSGFFENNENVTKYSDDNLVEGKVICELEAKTFIKYRVKDDPRIREQDFGNFQQVQSMKDVMEKRQTYGHFFFRFPQGESAADVYDRVASFQETLFRHFEKRDFKKLRDVVVLVSHGIYCRVFLMKWFRWTYEEYESFVNVPNGSMMVMELDESIDRYILRTELPRWC